MNLTPPFAYYGGKTRLAEQIVEVFPEHGHYVEPFGGSLAVLLAKTRSRMETVNDLDHALQSFWRVLRDQPEELERAMMLTPHSRAEHDQAYAFDEPGLSDLERARRVWVVLSQGRSGTLRRTGWRFYRNPTNTVHGMPDRLMSYADRVPAAARRLHGVSLECRPAVQLIEEYGVHSDVLLYVDPPYLGASRSSSNYRCEMSGRADHEDLAERLHRCKAAVVLSGYPSALYDELYRDWDRMELAAWTGNGIAAQASTTEGVRTEVLWSNRELQEREPDLFPDLLSDLAAPRPPQE